LSESLSTAPLSQRGADPKFLQARWSLTRKLASTLPSAGGGVYPAGEDRGLQRLSRVKRVCGVRSTLAWGGVCQLAQHASRLRCAGAASAPWVCRSARAGGGVRNLVSTRESRRDRGLALCIC
jgi:hypothetical protein